jgi:hypothetical protein
MKLLLMHLVFEILNYIMAAENRIFQLSAVKRNTLSNYGFNTTILCVYDLNQQLKFLSNCCNRQTLHSLVSFIH